MKAVYWVRDDLRIHDNRSLSEFAATATSGVMAWCTTPSFSRANPIRRKFILRSLAEFRKSVENLGGTLLVFDRPSPSVLPEVAESFGADTLFFTSLPIHEENSEERAMGELFKGKVRADPGSPLLHPADLPFAPANSPEVFTQFRKAVEYRLIVRPEAETPKVLPKPGSWSSPVPGWDPNGEISVSGPSERITPGERAGILRLDYYLEGSNRIRSYKETRNGLVDWDDSSKLSPYLSVGALSPRRIYFELKKYEKNNGANDSTYWLFFELIWRDYFKFISEKWGAKFFQKMKTPAKTWLPRDPAADRSLHDFECWCRGDTGDRFVDANMRELNATGWMSNRGRQNVASFLAKTLRVDWRLGADYFEKNLIDYDATSNWGNWAYLAGVGQDGRDRVFNTERQAALYDSAGIYRDKWCPLLPT